MENNEQKINPYKKIGEMHNKGLDFIIKKMSRKTSKGLSREQIVETVCEYMKLISSEITSIENAMNYAAIAHVLNNFNSENMSEYFRKLELSKEARDYVTELLSINSEDSTIILNKINEIEQKILNSALSERDKNYTLLMLAIADSSVKYWDKEQQKGQSLWRRVCGTVKTIPWKADVGGAAVMAVDPAANIIFGVVPGGIALVATKIVGAAVATSAFSYSARAQEEKERIAAEETRKKLLAKLGKSRHRLK